MPKRKLSPTPLRRQPRRATKKNALPSPPPLIKAKVKAKATKPKPKLPKQKAIKKMVSDKSTTEEAQALWGRFFNAAAELPALSCPPFASPTEPNAQPTVGDLEKKAVVVVSSVPGSNKKASGIVNRKAVSRKAIPSTKVHQESASKREDTSDLNSNDGFAASDSDTKFVSNNREFEEGEEERSPIPSTDTHSRIFDPSGTLVHESHSLPLPSNISTRASSKRHPHPLTSKTPQTTTITRNITYPLGAKLHYHHSASGTLFPSLIQSKRNPHVTDEEYALATTVKARNEAERKIPWDFDVPYGYDGFVRVSGLPADRNEEVVETINWIPGMRDQGARDSLRKVHEQVTAASETQTRLGMETERQVGKKKVDMTIKTSPTSVSGESERFIKINPPGQGELFYQKLAEHKGTHPLTFLSAATKENRELNNLYASNQFQGILPLTEDVPPHYPGLTQWDWAGPKVFEVVAWTAKGKMVKSMGVKRNQVLSGLEKWGKMESAKGTGGVGERQAEVADWVLRKLELDGGIPDVRTVPYGFVGYVVDDLGEGSGGEESFKVDWEGEGWRWEREAEIHGEGNGYWEGILEGGGDGESWWRAEVLSLEELKRAQMEGYVPWESQIGEGYYEWEGEMRVVDWKNAVGEKVGVRSEHLSRRVRKEVDGRKGKDLTPEGKSTDLSKKRKRG